MIGTSHSSSDLTVGGALNVMLGTDLSPIQPDFTPPNLRFEIDDCCSKWTYDEDSFDFIHVRCLYGSVADWPAFYEECFKYALNPAPTEQILTDVIAGISNQAVTLNKLNFPSSPNRTMDPSYLATCGNSVVG